MYRRDFRDSLLDIWKELEHIEEFSTNLDRKELIEDEKAFYAIVRCLEIMEKQ